MEILLKFHTSLIFEKCPKTHQTPKSLLLSFITLKGTNASTSSALRNAVSIQLYASKLMQVENSLPLIMKCWSFSEFLERKKLR